jgi:PTS system nitrogen regulatory IIA component
MKNDNESLVTLISRGGLYYRIAGTGVRELLGNLVRGLCLPPDVDAAIDREQLLKATLEREILMSTALGRGIALPHPRNPLITDSACQFAAIGFLNEPAAWNALDGEKVHTLIFVVSASSRLHLRILSRVNYFCQQENFRELLAKRAPPEEITGFIAETEQAWT